MGWQVLDDGPSEGCLGFACFLVLAALWSFFALVEVCGTIERCALEAEPAPCVVDARVTP